MTEYDRWKTQEPPDYADEPEPADPEAESLWESAPPPTDACPYCGGEADHDAFRCAQMGEWT